MNSGTQNLNLIDCEAGEKIYCFFSLSANLSYQRLEIFTSTRVEFGIGTGADSSRKIHVSISFTSCITMDEVWSVAVPVSTVHTESLCEIIYKFS